MAESPPGRRRSIIALSAGIEMATGIGLIAAPALVLALLFGPDMPAAALSVARVAGIALLALGLACWSPGSQPSGATPVSRALLTYNLLVAAYLAYLGLGAAIGGVLLWPAVALHGLIAAALLWTLQTRR